MMVTKPRAIGAAFLIYFVTYITVYYLIDQTWLPKPPQFDDVLLKKRPEGPLIMRDDIAKTIKKGTIILSKSLLSNGPIKTVADESTQLQTPSLQLIKRFKAAAKSVNPATKSDGKHSNSAELLLFTLVNEAYIGLTLNWLCNVHALSHDRPNATHIHRNVFIVGVGKKVCKRVLHDWPKVHCFTYEDDTSRQLAGKSLTWGQRDYFRLLVARAHFLAALAEERLRFVLFETDAVWLRDPRLKLFAVADQTEDTDIVLPLNHKSASGERFAFDPMLVLPSDAATRSLQELRRVLSRDPKTIDQTILNHLCASQYMGLVCREFAWSDIADGKWFKMSETQRQRHVKSTPPFVVNNNFYSGVDNKIARQALASLWFLSAKTNICNTSKAARLLVKYSV